jgi:two-component system, sensor histidine kinase and response regulator
MKKILVIDDEEWLRGMVKMALVERGYDVIEADNGATGIEIARAELPDLILCDVRMERVDGYLTLSTLHNEPATAAIPFILMTGMADTAGMRHGMELGADDYLPKPFTLDGLYAAVDARLRKAQTTREEAEKKLADLRDNISLMLPHEMLTPLNGIIGFAELLRMSADTVSPQEVAEMGQTIYESGKRLERLAQNFLVYVRMEITAGDPAKASAMREKSTLNAKKVMGDAALRSAADVGREADLKLDLKQDQPEISVPMAAEYLTKITEELVQNALKFSKPGTPVSVALVQSPEAVALTVNDRGRGLTPDQITRIGAYMQFNRKSQEQQGAGLGLIITKRITELHNGTLTLTSDAEQGTTATVKLPRAS